jgi:VIT1/CCC1 family predicted Fe2+/Mn2+ transporter
MELVVSVICILIAVGVVPIGKTRIESEEKRKKFLPLWWVIAIGAFLMAIAKAFGFMK